MTQLYASTMFAPAHTGTKALQTKPHALQHQRTGVLNDPYEGAYPMMGRMVSYPNPYDGLRLRLFGMGLIRPFVQAINAGIRVVDFATSSVNNAFATLAGVGGVVLLIKAFKDVSAIKPTAGLFALGAATYFGFKTVVKALDGQNTEAYDGDSAFRLGTALTYGAGAYLLLKDKGSGLGNTLKTAISKTGEGIGNILPTLKKLFDAIIK